MVALVATFFFFTLKDILWTQLPTPQAPIIFYSNQLYHPLRHLVIKALHSALHSIKMHTYALTDEAVIETLLQKQRVIEDIEVITDVKTLPSLFPLLKNPLRWKPTRSSGLMHTKILLLDEQLVFLGTANMTYESLSMHDNFIIGFYHKELASYLKRYTETIEKIKKEKHSSHALFSLPHQSLELWLLPYQGEPPLERLKSLIKSAKKSLSVAMFTLTHQELLDELIEAHQRGVVLKIFLDHTSAHGASAEALNTLIQAKVPVYLSTGVQLLHHKLMLVDETMFVLGSANWTKSAFKKNHDFFLMLHPLLREQTKVLKTLFKKISQASELAEE